MVAPRLLALVRCALTLDLGSSTVRRLEREFGDLNEAFHAPFARLSRLGERVPALLSTLASEESALAEIERLESARCDLAADDDPRYPAELRPIHDPPLFLCMSGPLPARGKRVAIVGSRKPTPYGRTQAAFLARELAQAGVVVVSGLAYGIDGIAHEAALEAGGETIAVLGSGLGRIYPERHRPLAARIQKQGALVTEHLFAEPPLAHHFPRRNRIISGLADAVLIVEAARKSGSLITATWALEQGRDVLAVPGPIDRQQSEGTNRLIQQGAMLVAGPDDVLAALGLEPKRVPADSTGADTEADGSLSTRLLRCLEESREMELDDLIAHIQHPAHEVLAALTRLELQGRVRRYPGRIYAVAR